MMTDMAIIKVEVNAPELKEMLRGIGEQRRKLFDLLTRELKGAATHAMNQMMNAEMTFFLGKHEQQGNKRNGYEVKQYALKGVGCVEVRVPVDRRRKFESVVVPKNEHIDPRLKEDLAVLHLAGISTRDLAMISKRLLGVEVSKQTVSNSLGLIEEKALSWLTRPLTSTYWALYIDGTNFKIQRRGSTEAEPSLVVLGIDSNNRKSILAIEPGTKDNAEAWRAVFNELTKRGLKAEHVRIGIMDGLSGLENAFKEHFTNAVTARCWVHALKNSLNKAPERLRDSLKRLSYNVMYAPSESAARSAFSTLKAAMGTDAERAVNCLEKDLEALLVHYRFESDLWIALKTTNPIERINKEFKKRSRSMGSLGEHTLKCLTAFTALRLEMGWRKMSVNSPQLAKLKHMGDKTNLVEEAFSTLVH